MSSTVFDASLTTGALIPITVDMKFKRSPLRLSFHP